MKKRKTNIVSENLCFVFPNHRSFARHIVAILFVMSGGLCRQVGLGVSQGETASSGRTEARNGDAVFETINIIPSPIEGEYIGHFRFIHKGKAALSMPGHDEIKGDEFFPASVRYQILSGNKWLDIKTSSSGLFNTYQIEPEKEYKLIIDLDCFKEGKAPLTIRVGVENGRFWSTPFKLDIRTDRSTGQFSDARRERYAKVRQAFQNVGFSRERLEGADFCASFMKSLASHAPVTDGQGHNIPPDGEVFRVPFFLHGKVYIDFIGNKNSDGLPGYESRIILDPSRFSRSWLASNLNQIRLKGDVIDNHIFITLDDGLCFSDGGSIINLELIYNSGAASVPTPDQLAVMRGKIIYELGEWLREKEDDHEKN